MDDHEVEKAIFYSGRIGDPPCDVHYICMMATVIIHSISLISQHIDNILLRNTFEILILSISLFFLVYSASLAFISFALPLLLCKPNNHISNSKRSSSLLGTKLTTLFLTTICIIFVDFPSFPPGHAKTSQHLFFHSNMVYKIGYSTLDSPTEDKNGMISLMDTGAAFFVLLNGYSHLSFNHCMKNAVINLILWGTRFLATKSTNYFVPEGEYAPNCNFFGYIGSVQLIAAFFSLLNMNSAYIAIFLTIIHELTSNNYPFIGYATLFFVGNSIGFKHRIHDLFELCLHLLFSFLPFIFTSMNLIHPLREKINASFSLLIISLINYSLQIGNNLNINYNNFSVFYRAIDQNSMIYFLSANVLTGIVNLTFDTNHSSFITCFLTTNLIFIISGMLTIGVSVIKPKLSN